MKAFTKLLHKVRERYYVETETHDALGRQKMDPNPVEVPVGFTPPPTLQQQLAQMLRARDIVAAQRARGEETLEDSVDFGNDDDDPLPSTAAELRDMKEEAMATAAADYARQERLEAYKKAQDAKKPPKQEKPKEEPKTEEGKKVE